MYLLYYVCIAAFTLDAGLLARGQYSEGPATGHLDAGFSWFPCVYKQMLRWIPRFQVTTTCFSCSPPYLNFLVPNFIFCVHVNNHCHRVTTQLQLIIIIIIIIIINSTRFSWIRASVSRQAERQLHTSTNEVWQQARHSLYCLFMGMGYIFSAFVKTKM